MRSVGATEVDVNFNANVVTHSTAACCTHWRMAELLVRRLHILALPSFRDRIPVIVDV